MSRRTARETAFRMLFQMDLGKNDYAAAQHTMDEAMADKTISYRDCPYIKDVVLGVEKQKNRLDEFISRHSHDWDISRINPVERNIIRLALYEVWYVDDVPLEVALNEAIELAKEYGDSDAYGFVNGILDNVKKEIKAAENLEAE